MYRLSRSLGARERVAISDSGTLDSLAGIGAAFREQVTQFRNWRDCTLGPESSLSATFDDITGSMRDEIKAVSDTVGTEITGHGRQDQTIRKLLHQTTPRTNNQDLELTICLATASQRHYLKAFNQLQAQLTQRKCEGFRVHSAACQPQLLPLRMDMLAAPFSLGVPIANLYEADAPSSKRKACLAAVPAYIFKAKQAPIPHGSSSRPVRLAQKFVAEHAGEGMLFSVKSRFAIGSASIAVRQGARQKGKLLTRFW